MLDAFFRMHDATARGRSRQYASIIFAHNDAQREAAERCLSKPAQNRAATTVEPATPFWDAEAYHQKWLLQRKPAGTSDVNLDYGLLVQFGGYNVGYRNLSAWFGDGANLHKVETTLRLEDNDWHHVSLAYDAERRVLRFGLDEQFEEHGFEKPDFAPSGPTLIGAHSNAQGVVNQYLRGAIDELRITRAFLPPSALLRSR